MAKKEPVSVRVSEKINTIRQWRDWDNEFLKHLDKVDAQIVKLVEKLEVDNKMWFDKVLALSVELADPDWLAFKELQRRERDRAYIAWERKPGE